ncbi:MAG: hypothetical protein EOM21_20200 [Gammaproteobacteria bacterium]|nr:hypothetical protein [Gammaproteobacteria bacterium]
MALETYGKQSMLSGFNSNANRLVLYTSANSAVDTQNITAGNIFVYNATSYKLNLNNSVVFNISTATTNISKVAIVNSTSGNMAIVALNAVENFTTSGTLTLTKLDVSVT